MACRHGLPSVLHSSYILWANPSAPSWNALCLRHAEAEGIFDGIFPGFLMDFLDLAMKMIENVYEI